jgi:uncharacterized protein
MKPSWAARGLMTLVRGYRLMLSPWLGASCRFEPTCSVYSLGVLERHGALAGSTLTVYRLLRCHPLCAGGHDPVPDNPPALFRRFMATPRSPSPLPDASSHD